MELTKKFTWNQQSIKWYIDSQNNTEFYTKTLKELDPYINNANTLLDIGCGPGGFATEFAKKGLNITAIDISPLIIETLEELNIENIDFINADLKHFMPSFNYDIVFASYLVGNLDEEDIIKFLKYTNKYFIIIFPKWNPKKNFDIDSLYNDLGLNIDNPVYEQHLKILKFLDDNKINYNIDYSKSEFGQYFNSINEACSFIYNYYDIPIKYETEIKKWLNKKLLIMNKRYYLPNTKDSMIVIIKKEG